ncbi:hypothetical protein ES705_17055 [subsurface metagenome]
MFKRNTIKNRMSFFIYSSILTITILFLLLAGGIFASVQTEKSKVDILKSSDIGLNNNEAPNLADFSFLILYESFTTENSISLTQFIKKMTPLGSMNNFVPYLILKKINIGVPINISTSTTNISYNIIGVSQSTLNWMFPNTTFSTDTIHLPNSINQLEHVEVGKNVTIESYNNSKEVTIGQFYDEPYFIFDNKITDVGLVPLSSFFNLIENRNIRSLYLSVFIDSESDYLCKLSLQKIDNYFNEVKEDIDVLAEKNNVLINYWFYWRENFAESIRENLLTQFGQLQVVLAPTYLLLLLIFWFTMTESFIPLKKEYRLFLTRGAKPRKFIQHYLVIFILFDFSFLLLFGIIGEIISQLSWQTSSIGFSLISGILTLVLLEMIKIIALILFTKHEQLFFKTQTEKPKSYRNKKGLSGKYIIILLAFGGIVFGYSYLIPLFLPFESLTPVVQITRIVSGVILLLTIALFSSKLSLNTLFRFIQHSSSVSFLAVSKLLYSLFLSKRRRFQFFSIIGFWVILLSTYVINSYGMDVQIKNRYWQTYNLDIGLYLGGDSQPVMNPASYLLLDDVSNILSDNDIKNYIQVARLRVIEEIGGNEVNRGTIVFLPFANVTAACPSFLSFENSKGESVNASVFSENENRVLLSHKAIMKEKHKVGDNLTLNILIHGPVLNSSLTERQSVNITIYDDFTYVPFFNNEPFYEFGDYGDYVYLADFSLMEKIFGASFFSYILFELKEDVDPHQWYNSIRNKLSNVEDQFMIIFTKDKIKEYSDIYVLLPIEGFLLSLIAIFFTFFYFQVIFRENEKQLLTSISRGMDPKLLQRTIFKCSVLLVMINILLSFIMGIIISVVIPFGPSFGEIKMFHISFLSSFVLLEFGGIILGSLIILIINHITLMKRINTSNLTTLRETILG